MLIGLKRRADCEEGAPSLMKDLHLYLLAVNGPTGHGASGLPQFQQQDVSTVPGCIDRVLRSTLR